MNFKFTYSEIEELGGNLPMKKRKSRFTFDEVHLLLTEVKRNRHILVSKYLHSVCTVGTNDMNLIHLRSLCMVMCEAFGHDQHEALKIDICLLCICFSCSLHAFYSLVCCYLPLSPTTGKFNQGASSDLRKRTWADIAIRINKISECQREVMEIVKKWADLKCDAKRRMVAMRGPNGVRISQNMSPVEKMVHEILATSPPNKATMGSMNHEPEENDFGDMSEMLTRSSGTSNGMAGLHHMGMPGTSPHAMGSSMSPFSTQDKDIGMFSRMPFGRESFLYSEQCFS